MMIRFSRPEATASSTAYWIIGLSTSASISFGCAFVAGRNLVPKPAAGNTARRIVIISPPLLQTKPFKQRLFAMSMPNNRIARIQTLLDHGGIEGREISQRYQGFSVLS